MASANSALIRNAGAPACLLPAGDWRIEDGIARVDLEHAGGSIQTVRPAGPAGLRPTHGGPVLDQDGGMLWPGFVDLHTHLDKAHIWPRANDSDGSFESAVEAVRRDRESHWSEDDLTARMDFALRCAYAHGTVALRTHLDSSAPQHEISWPVFAEMRERWRGRIELQAVALVTAEELASPFGEELADLVVEHRGVLGGVTFMMPNLDRVLERIFALARERALDLDLHVDESLDPAARSLRLIADARIRTGFAGRVVCGHCCSLAVQEEAEAQETIARVRDADLAVVSLPMCNLYLQDRHPGRTPRLRGITLLHELHAAGVLVALASDNARDPFHGYGDLDMLEVFREAVRIGHLDRPVGSWPAAVSRTPARLMRLDGRGVLAPGAPADLVLFRARTWSELLSRPQADRTVLRAGQPIDARPAGYRTLGATLP